MANCEREPRRIPWRRHGTGPASCIEVWSLGERIRTCCAFVALNCFRTTISTLFLRHARALLTRYETSLVCRAMEADLSKRPSAERALYWLSIPCARNQNEVNRQGCSIF